MIVRFAPATAPDRSGSASATLLVIVGPGAAPRRHAAHVNSWPTTARSSASLAVVLVTPATSTSQAIVFLTGLQIDSLVRRQLEGADEGQRDEAPEIIVLARSLPVAPRS